jgi:hypothetical protein
LEALKVDSPSGPTLVIVVVVQPVTKKTKKTKKAKFFISILFWWVNPGNLLGLGQPGANVDEIASNPNPTKNQVSRP